MEFDFREVGGVARVAAGGDPNDPADLVWNFGIQPQTPAVAAMVAATPTLYERFPNLQGVWDGKSPINHAQVALKVLGSESAVEALVQMQPEGTCGGRSGSAGGDLSQCLMVAAGRRAKFHRCSHAWLYFAARRKYHMLGGRGNDGVASGSVPEIMSDVGFCSREETGDTNAYGDGSDDLACQLGAGRGDAAKIAEWDRLAADNKVTAKVRVKSAQELADALASPGVCVCSDMQGYDMERDAEGFCKPRGQWAHYHVRAGIVVNSRGRKGFAYWQSWGKTTPRGPRLEGYPPNCFGVDWDVQDRLCRTGDVDVIFQWDPFELEQGPVDLPWMF